MGCWSSSFVSWSVLSKGLPELQQAGKTIIAISHDDHYFDITDRIYKLDIGKLSVYGKTEQLFFSVN